MYVGLLNMDCRLFGVGVLICLVCVVVLNLLMMGFLAIFVMFFGGIDGYGCYWVNDAMGLLVLGWFVMIEVVFVIFFCIGVIGG